MDDSVILIIVVVLIFVFAGIGFHLRNKELNFLAGIFFFLSLLTGLASGAYILDSIEDKTIKGIVMSALIISVMFIVHLLDKLISKNWEDR